MAHSKIINDPVHGFIEIPKGIILALIDTDIFQRLRRIKQLALSSLVYPGAVHSRFNHCIGAMHLTRQALDVLRSKGQPITDEEYQGALLAILLHDIGHGPFSHALENVILPGLHHEQMSRAIMLQLNAQFDGALQTAIDIFENKHPKVFLHQLVSSQLDMDRMDYLVRDSYFTGVVEGLVSGDRIIKTLNVADNKLVVEAKGIYSVEKFIMARRLMYWQVYLHRAVIAGEYMLVGILKRAKELMGKGVPIWSNKLLDYFFRLDSGAVDNIDAAMIEKYICLDDQDILYGIKQWQFSGDKVLEKLCKNLLRRKLLKVRIYDHAVDPLAVDSRRKAAMKSLGFSEAEARYFVFTGNVSNLAYGRGPAEPISILHKDGSVEDIATASDMQNVAALTNLVTKEFFAFPAEGF